MFQLVNKFDELKFTRNDENFVEAFAIFCGMGLNNVRMYEKTVVAMAKQQVTLEVLSYHAAAPIDDAIKLASKVISSAAAIRLQSFSFDDFGLDDDATLQVGRKRKTHSFISVLCHAYATGRPQARLKPQ